MEIYNFLTGTLIYWKLFVKSMKSFDLKFNVKILCDLFLFFWQDIFWDEIF